MKANFPFLEETAKGYLCQKLKLDRICLVEKPKSFMDEGPRDQVLSPRHGFF